MNQDDGQIAGRDLTRLAGTWHISLINCAPFTSLTQIPQCIYKPPHSPAASPSPPWWIGTP